MDRRSPQEFVSRMTDRLDLDAEDLAVAWTLAATRAGAIMDHWQSSTATICVAAAGDGAIHIPSPKAPVIPDLRADAICTDRATTAESGPGVGWWPVCRRRYRGESPNSRR
jgi:hypothetical protein